MAEAAIKAADALFLPYPMNSTGAVSKETIYSTANWQLERRIMSQRCNIGLIATIALITLPAHADWQYTRWGMTPAEVKAADSSVVINELPASPKYANRMQAPYAVSGVSFRANFLFERDTNKLSVVRLDVISGQDCPKLEAILRRTYGAPDSIDAGHVENYRTMTWRDRSHFNEVDLTDGTTACSVTYNPLLAPGAKGGL